MKAAAAVILGASLSGDSPGVPNRNAGRFRVQLTDVHLQKVGCPVESVNFGMLR
jgi:hypothetical protein